MVLTGLGLGGFAGVFSVLSQLQTLHSDLKGLLDNATKELISVLTELKPQFESDKPEAEAILRALGRLARAALVLNQKMLQLQQVPTFGGGPASD